MDRQEVRHEIGRMDDMIKKVREDRTIPTLDRAMLADAMADVRNLGYRSHEMGDLAGANGAPAAFEAANKMALAYHKAKEAMQLMLAVYGHD